MSIFKRTQRKYVKKAYRVRNWREYEAGLRNRGSLTVWISLTAGKPSALGKTDPGVLAMNDPWTEHDREHVITGARKERCRVAGCEVSKVSALRLSERGTVDGDGVTLMS